MMTSLADIDKYQGLQMAYLTETSILKNTYFLFILSQTVTAFFSLWEVGGYVQYYD